MFIALPFGIAVDNLEDQIAHAKERASKSNDEKWVKFYNRQAFLIEKVLEAFTSIGQGESGFTKDLGEEHKLLSSLEVQFLKRKGESEQFAQFTEDDDMWK